MDVNVWYFSQTWISCLFKLLSMLWKSFKYSPQVVILQYACSSKCFLLIVTDISQSNGSKLAVDWPLYLASGNVHHLPLNVPPATNAGCTGWKSTDIRQLDVSITESGLSPDIPLLFKFQVHRPALCVHQSSWSKRPYLCIRFVKDTIDIG